ncbi:hypothetical protein F441_07138 [Phytophthora nicotianae CJ01A1]|uniref:Uncharacterized protein n=6 Tax=Phytophthora nicotianae TaxID=4792 RepID=V9FDQ3_PHYNI|nr:hypothetical protein F443_07120 [Phytophthora nicotianae P1569]ETK88769.1 hypothetical protein L915_07015 [Phytophthora nicotianae]ETP18651.1 hypothetical protein F441_07144 [Phytophthora nicotianae CJ01A1]ETP18660.1 hypothetical protein F441_07138 [Phytophthora nicotianae CJ01A1]
MLAKAAALTSTDRNYKKFLHCTCESFTLLWPVYQRGGPLADLELEDQHLPKNPPKMDSTM